MYQLHKMRGQSRQCPKPFSDQPSQKPAEVIPVKTWPEPSTAAYFTSMSLGQRNRQRRHQASLVSEAGCGDLREEVNTKQIPKGYGV